MTITWCYRMATTIVAFEGRPVSSSPSTIYRAMDKRSLKVFRNSAAELRHNPVRHVHQLRTLPNDKLGRDA